MPPDEPIQLASYDSSWPLRSEEEKAGLIERSATGVIGDVHHVGSTAVPGLAAKPIIDILAGVRDLDESRACVELLAELDYLYAPVDRPAYRRTAVAEAADRPSCIATTYTRSDDSS
jgi:GrpB-like predicted nucleotidyltransferase (UPF0157 family)